MRKPFFIPLMSAVLFLAATLSASANVRLPAIFSNNMVLQRGTKVTVWGWADDGEKVTVKFRDQKVSTTAKNGKWSVKLSSLKAGGPDTFTVVGNNSVTLTNVLVGEVWVCSGQSNMEFALKRAFESEKDISSSSNRMIRFFAVPNLRTNVPMKDVNANWTQAGPETSGDFSAVGYYFGRDLQKALGVPVGLIQSDWGGTPAEAWMNPNVLENNPRYKKEIVTKAAEAQKNFEAGLAKAKNNKNGKAEPRAPWQPGELYYGMITPLQPYAIKGVIWYQGEANAPRAEQYRTLLPDLIQNWRNDWCHRNFSFLIAQLAPFKQIKDQPAESDWAELREAQQNATRVMPKVGVAVITDVGEQNDIHPKKKEPVGHRLALAARGITYGEKIVYAGPVFTKMKVKGDQAILSFDNVGGGLESRGGALKGFSICGEDHKFVWATAEIHGDKVVVSSPNVKHPVAVRFGWADYPVVNLWNKDGLPASPFRTDNFPMITAPRK